MYKTRVRRAAALLLALAFLATLTPASAVPAPSADRTPVAADASGSFVDSVVAWFSGLLPGTASPPGAHSPERLVFGARSRGERDGDPGSQPGPESTSDDPTADPQLGSDLDPNG